MKNVTTNVELSDSYSDIKGYTPVIGWFSNKYNPVGWAIVSLNEHELKFCSDHGYSNDEIFQIKRIVSPKGNTSLSMFNFQKGTYAFVDNEILMENGVLRFEKKVKFTKARINPLFL